MSDDELSSHVADSPYQLLGFICPSCLSDWAFPGVFLPDLGVIRFTAQEEHVFFFIYLLKFTICPIWTFGGIF